MAISIFKAFRSTVTPPNQRQITPYDKWHVDPVTGAIIGVISETATGPNARFTPVDITLAQLAAPTLAMIQDLDATYRINVAPYSRFQSDGSQLISIGGGGETEVVIPPGFNVIYYAPLTISTPQELLVQGQVRVESYPA